MILKSNKNAAKSNWADIASVKYIDANKILICIHCTCSTDMVQLHHKYYITLEVDNITFVVYRFQFAR